MAVPVPSTVRRQFEPERRPVEQVSAPGRAPVETIVVLYRDDCGIEIRTRNGNIEVDVAAPLNEKDVKNLLVHFAKRDVELAISMAGVLVSGG